jgi:hypothetical protein
MATAAVPSRLVLIRDEAAYMACGVWMVVGLYLDGWSHQADKPDSFLTPWHALLYSGFGAAVVWSGWMAVRDARLPASERSTTLEDRITSLGVALFAIGAIGDGIWHTVIGIEVDIEGLISPTHLLLMTGGLLMVTLPIRAALRAERPVPRRELGPVLVSMTLALAVVCFFLMYLMPWTEGWHFLAAYVPESDASNDAVVVGMAQVIVTSALFVGAVLWTARRWTLPFGTATATFTSVSFALSGLGGFDVRLPVLGAVLGGLVLDVLLRDGRPYAVIGAASGAAMWAGVFAMLHAESGVGWGPSLWVGAIVFAGVSGLGAGVAVRER